MGLFYSGGGADGSIMTFADVETKYPANVGLDEIVNIEAPFAKFHNMTPGDFIHFAGAVAVTNCPGAPSLSFSLGRPIGKSQASVHRSPLSDRNSLAKGPASDGLVPAPFDTLDKIFDRMQDALGFTPVETVWALAAHSIGSASDVDPSIPRTPFDSTPGIFDAQFFVETQLRGTLFPGKGGIQGEVESPMKGEIRLQSDHLMARDSRSSCEWQSFVTDHAKLQNRFQFAMETIAVVGQDTTNMVDCSEVIPQPHPLPFLHPSPVLPVGMFKNDIEQAVSTPLTRAMELQQLMFDFQCASTPFPIFQVPSVGTKGPIPPV